MHLADVGGTIGLYLGATIVTLVELFFFMLSSTLLKSVRGEKTGNKTGDAERKFSKIDEVPVDVAFTPHGGGVNGEPAQKLSIMSMSSNIIV